MGNELMIHPDSRIRDELQRRLHEEFRAEAKERIQLAIDWLKAIDLLWIWGDRNNPVVQWANEILEVANVTQVIEPLEPDDAVLASHLDELDRCVVLVICEASEWGEIWANPRKNL